VGDDVSFRRSRLEAKVNIAAVVELTTAAAFLEFKISAITVISNLTSMICRLASIEVTVFIVTADLPQRQSSQ
jgi:hypothetical protein